MSTYITATAARKNFFSLIEQASKPGSYIIVTHQGIPKVVLISQKDFDKLQNKLNTLHKKYTKKDSINR